MDRPTLAVDVDRAIVKSEQVRDRLHELLVRLRGRTPTAPMPEARKESEGSLRSNVERLNVVLEEVGVQVNELEQQI